MGVRTFTVLGIFCAVIFIWSFFKSFFPQQQTKKTKKTGSFVESSRKTKKKKKQEVFPTPSTQRCKTKNQRTIFQKNKKRENCWCSRIKTSLIILFIYFLFLMYVSFPEHLHDEFYEQNLPLLVLPTYAKKTKQNKWRTKHFLFSHTRHKHCFFSRNVPFGRIFGNRRCSLRCTLFFIFFYIHKNQKSKFKNQKLKFVC